MLWRRQLGGEITGQQGRGWMIEKVASEQRERAVWTSGGRTLHVGKSQDVPGWFREWQGGQHVEQCKLGMEETELRRFSPLSRSWVSDCRPLWGFLLLFWFTTGSLGMEEWHDRTYLQIVEEQKQKQGDCLGGDSITPGGRWWWLRPEWRWWR